MKLPTYCLLVVAFSVLPLSADEVGEEAREAALRERPFLFGVAVDWNPFRFPASPERYRERLEEQVRSLGATATRVTFDWSVIERSPGEYDFEEADNNVRRALDLGIAVVGRILGSPGWANSKGKAGLYPPRASMASDFSLFCERLAARYRNRVNHFEFWIEPDGAGWRPRPSAREYARWLWACRDAIRRGNPRAALAVGALGPRGLAFLGEMLDLSSEAPFDAVAVNGHPPEGNPTAGQALDTGRIEEIRSLCQKPIWVTAYGWPAEEVGIQEQAEMVTRALDWMVEREWITVAILERMADPPGAVSDLSGLCDESLVPRPAYRSFARYVMAPGRIEEELEPPRFAEPHGEQLLTNPGFEETNQSGDPKGWSRWGADGSAGGKAVPEEGVLLPKPHGGKRAALILKRGETIQGGLSQTFAVPDGTWLAASVWTYVSFTHLPPKARIGINLRGEAEPGDDNTTWSEWYTANDGGEGWVEIGLRYPVKVEGDRATVFLEWSQPIPAGRSAVGFDDVRVSPVEP